MDGGIAIVDTAVGVWSTDIADNSCCTLIVFPPTLGARSIMNTPNLYNTVLTTERRTFMTSGCHRRLRDETDGSYVVLASASAGASWVKPTVVRSAFTVRDADIMIDGGSSTVMAHKNNSSRGSSTNGRGRGSAWESGLNDNGSIEKGCCTSSCSGAGAIFLVRLRTPLLLSLPLSALATSDIFVFASG
jgi:hypothetical protein